MDALFFARMEDILHLYSLPYKPSKPLIVFDERPCFLIGDVLTPIPMEAGMPKREHYEYEKNGSCTVFLAFEPATGQRWVEVFEKRSGLEYAKFMQYVSDQFKDVKKIVLVQDNLSTHSSSSFYSHLKPDAAFKLVQRPKPVRCWCWVKKKFEFHFTPVKSSWLNMRPRPSGASWGQEGGIGVECAFTAVFE